MFDKIMSLLKEYNSIFKSIDSNLPKLILITFYICYSFQALGIIMYYLFPFNIANSIDQLLYSLVFTYLILLSIIAYEKNRKKGVLEFEY